MSHPRKKEIDAAVSLLPSLVMPVKDIRINDPGNVALGHAEEIRDSIKDIGQQVPVLIAKNGGEWNLMDGKHRMWAINDLGIETALVRDITELKRQYGF